jgi:hypothetical protein
MSTTVARTPVVGASVGGAIIAAVVAAAAAASCCSPVAVVVPCGGTPVAAALQAARGALDERRLIGTDVSDLSALAGARAGTDDVTLPTKKIQE